jgi:GNAT superfamily N-acetyltransferase
MGITCRIVTDSNGNVDYIETEQGVRSELFDQLRTLVGTERALEYYALTESETFKEVQVVNIKESPNAVKVEKSEVNGKLVYAPHFKGTKMGALRLLPYEGGYRVDSVIVYDKFKNKGVGKKLYKYAINDLSKQGIPLYSLNVRAPYAENIWKGLVEEGIATKEGNNFKALRIKEEPKVEDVMLYANETDAPLNREQSVQAIDALASFKVSNSLELFDKLKEAFIQDGSFVFDRKKLEKAGYNSYEITEILTNRDLQQGIKENLFKVKNTELSIDIEDLEITKTDEIGIFGKQLVYVNTEREAVSEIVEQEIRDKKTDTVQTLVKTYPQDRPNIDVTPFETVLKITNNVAKNNPKKLKKVVLAMQEEASKYGVDLRGIADRIYPVGRLKSFTESVINYIANPTNSFAEVYDKFFEVSQLPKTKYAENEVKLDTELTEYELFRDYNLVRKEGNTYTKVSPENIEDLHNYFFRQQEDYKTKEDIQKDVPELEVEDYEAESDVLEAMFIWKKFLGYPIKTQSNDKPPFRGMTNNPYKMVTTEGVVLKNNDTLTRAKAELYEEETVKEEKDYQDEVREKISLGEIKPDKINTDYTIVEDEVLMTKNNTNQFLRTPLANYELIFQDGNLSFFKEVVGTEKNFSDIDFTKYVNESVKPDKYIEAKNSYSKKELEEINNQYFSCK